MVIPLATYRLQLHAEFGFDEAAAIADYLHELGVSHVYCSPYLQAGRGSRHGYDVLDHATVNAELGGAARHDAFCTALGRADLGQVLDIVPNHMSISGRGNAWWWDVLENGEASRYATFFDVDWRPPEEKLHNLVLLPILGDHYWREVEAGKLRIARDGGSFTVQYFDHAFPLAPPSLDALLADAAEAAHCDELAFLADSLRRLPPSTASDRTSVARRHRDKEVIRRQLAQLCAVQPAVAGAIDAAIAHINAAPEALDVLLDRQNYRLAYWKTARHELDYRRFFDISTLVSLRMEDEAVFRETHGLVLEWVRGGLLDGLRVDHPDGLRDPEAYFRRLAAEAPSGWIVVEKILEPGERLPDSWPVHGTTGYDFLNRLGGLLVDPTGEAPLSEFYTRFTGLPTDYVAMVHEKKHLVLRDLFASDVQRLTAMLVRLCERQKRYRDYTRRDLDEMLREVIACFPVYRTYVRAEVGQVSADDRRYVNEALEAARRNRPDIDPALFDLLRDLLLVELRGDAESDFVMRFQQHSGPVMAKGVEDTVFYNFNRLTSLNEVGGDPGQFGVTLEQFHRQCQESQQRFPHTMLATTTHDTKRSEDVRARISLLAEIPGDWAAAVLRWAAHNEPYRRDELPDRNLEYLYYQTLIGAWPIERGRMLAYLEKAAREAKAYTSWTDPCNEYEEAVARFVNETYADATFMDEVARFVRPMIEPGRVNSLAQTLVKLLSPGVPDVYQGTELWDMSLVNPDNRRPVDFALRRKLLGELMDLSPEAILRRSDEGLPKLWVTRQALHVRRALPELFRSPELGAYAPLWATGAKSNHVIAFRRGERVIAVAPRFPLRLAGDWEDTALDLLPSRWTNHLTGEEIPGGTVPLSRLFRRFPVALLVAQVAKQALAAGVEK